MNQPSSAENLFTESTFDKYIPQNESQIKAKTIMQTLVNLLIENGGNLQEPIIIGINSKPGLGKTHLIKAFYQEINSKGIGCECSLFNKYILTSETYYKSNIIILDDLFHTSDNLIGTKQIGSGEYMTRKNLIKLIFDVYEHNKILIITSNFDINEILKEIGNIEVNNPRLKSRIDHLLSHTQPIEITGEDYRKKKAKEGGLYKGIFEKSIADALNGK